MPTKRTRRPIARRHADGGRLTLDLVADLLDGGPILDADGGFPRPEDAADAWEEHREGVLPVWIASYPGTRPHAWWRFEARQELVLAGVMDWRLPTLETQTAYLRRHGLLRPDEIATLGDRDGTTDCGRPVSHVFRHLWERH